MIAIRPIVAAASSLLASLVSNGAEIPITFEVLESSRTRSISYSTGNTSEQVIQYHGTMEALVSFDSADERPTAIRFTGGILRESDSRFENTANIHFYGAGTKRVTTVQSTSGLQLSFRTKGITRHAVDAYGRVADVRSTESFPVAGILSATLTIDGRTQTQEIDVATRPPLDTRPTSGTQIRLRLVELKNSGSTSDFRITFDSSQNSIRDSRNLATDTTVTSTSVGKTLAETTFSAPNRYGQWLLDNGYTLDDELSHNSHGIPLALLFAFNLRADDAQGLPWSISNASGTPILTLQLPPGGLQRAIQVQSCDDPQNDEWNALGYGDFLYGNSSLERGATGLRRIRCSGSPAKFFRIATLVGDE